MYHIRSKRLKNREPNSALHFQELEKEKHIKPQISRRKKIECRNIEKINETKTCFFFFEMENNREKSLARLIKKNIENTQIDTFICIIKWKRRCYK